MIVVFFAVTGAGGADAGGGAEESAGSDSGTTPAGANGGAGESLADIIRMTLQSDHGWKWKAER